jgi:hypothetical protein
LETKILEPDARFIPIRLAYFKRPFWDQWGELEAWQRDVYILGWLAKLDHTLTRLEKKLMLLQEENIETDRDRNIG